jgi:hypothetical protein
MMVIQGEKFIELADNNRIFYCHTHDVKGLLEAKKNDPPYILITHNSDAEVNIVPPSNVIRWFAQNVNIVDPRIESIPIGLENNKWFPEERKKERMHEISLIPKPKKNLVYLNHNVKTHPERKKLYPMFEDKTWVTAEKGVNGKGFDHYINNVRSHMFSFCPRGNGIDTHRTWECLYMGTIPIEKRNINNQFYTDLPICFVDEWEEVTEDFLAKEYIRIMSSPLSLEKLLFNYWKNKITSNE